VKLKGDYVDYMPEFFKTIKEFDQIQRSKLKSYRDYNIFLQKKLLKKLAKNKSAFTKLNK